LASYELEFSSEAKAQLERLDGDPALLKRRKSVRKALGYLETNPRHQSLQTHKYQSLKGPNKEEVFEAYAENQVSAAYRIFWYYGPSSGKITIIAITPHP
jgi:bisphosphoglycerate-dependent phosphoglycerate mutase